MKNYKSYGKEAGTLRQLGKNGLPPVHFWEYETPMEAIDSLWLSWLHEDPRMTIHSRILPRYFTHNHIILIKNPIADISLHRVGITKKRWSRFSSEYIAPLEYKGWLEKASNLRKGQEIAYHPPQITHHNLGSCLISMSINIDPQARLFAMSRASLWLPTAVLDMSFFSLASQHLQNVMGIKDPIPVIWTIPSMQFHCWQSLFRVHDPDLQYEIPDNPTGAEVQKINERYLSGDIPKYKIFRRIAQRLTDLRNGDFEVYYPTLPSSYEPDIRGDYLTLEDLMKRFNITRRTVRYTLRPYRLAIQKVTGETYHHTYDMVWPEDHPEIKALEWSLKFGKIKNPAQLYAALEVESPEDIKKLYEGG